MKTYHFQVEITEASGSQTFAVQATSEAEALKKLKSGGGEIVASDVEVQGLQWSSAQCVEVIEETSAKPIDDPTESDTSPAAARLKNFTAAELEDAAGMLGDPNE